jgi:hypothetical protein
MNPQDYKDAKDEGYMDGYKDGHDAAIDQIYDLLCRIDDFRKELDEKKKEIELDMKRKGYDKEILARRGNL